MDKDFPCKCNHPQEAHYLKIDACWYCACIGNWCTRFVGDNLRFLEEQFKEN